MLQCTALQTVVEKAGHHAVVVDYEPDYLVQVNNLFFSPFVYAKKVADCYEDRPVWYRLIRGTLGFFKALWENALFFKRWRTARKFNRFMKRHMHLSPRAATKDALARCTPELDALLCGSDQIWNPLVSGNGLDPVYFGDFTPERTAVYSYAASICKLEKVDVDDLGRLSARLKEISLREESTARWFTEQLDRPARTDVDPTLLLTREDYAALEEPVKTQGDYVLIYTLPNPASRKLIEETVLQLLREHPDLKVIDISYAKVSALCKLDCYRFVPYLSPGEFLSYIKNARCVVTNSFHGVALSIVYEKVFWTAVHSKLGVRATDLLKALSLDDRIVTDPAEHAGETVDYAAARPHLQAAREQSMEYLNQILGAHQDAE